MHILSSSLKCSLSKVFLVEKVRQRTFCIVLQSNFCLLSMESHADVVAVLHALTYVIWLRLANVRLPPLISSWQYCDPFESEKEKRITSR